MFAISAAFAQLPDQKKGEAPPTHTDKKDSGTQKPADALKPQPIPVPPTVNVIASGEVKLIAQQPKDNGDKGGDKGHENIKFWVDVVLAGATVGLFIATFLLYCATRGLVKEAQKQFPEFKKNVKAASNSASAVVLAGRAYVKMSPQQPGIAFDDETNHINIKVEVKNFGNTPAIVTETLAQWTMFDSRARLPIEPIYEEKRRYSVDAFLVKNENMFVTSTFELNAETIKRMRTDMSFYLYGYVDYIDVFKVRHRGGFARIYDRNATGQNLTYVIEKNYNYDRPRKNGEGNDWDKAI